MAKASQVVIMEGEYYIIKSPNGKVLEVKDFNTENGAGIQLWSYAGHPWQQWQFVDAGEGRWRIQNRFTGKMIDLALGGVVEGTWLHQWSRTSGLSQCWALEPTRSGRTRIRNVLAAFLFTGDDVFKRIADLSGGEKGRVSLAKLMLSNANFLILDEPTNHLDIMSKEILEDALNHYEGTVLYVSHDRYFMDKVVDHLLVFRGNADIKDFPGNYTQYRDWKEVQDQLEKEAEAVLQARQNPAPEKPSRPVNEQKKKLTFKERKEFEALEEEIPALEAEKAELETAMSSGTLSTDELMAKSQRITQVMEEIDEKTMRWLELSELA